MLRIKYLNNKISELKRNINRYQRSELPHDKAYVAHMKRLLDAYEAERIKAYERPAVIEPDNDYIFDYFPRRSELI